MKNEMKTELLSPAGDIESAYSAFYFGADAIYLGLQRFSARAEATNFSEADLNEITAYAHAHGKKVYVAVNTIMQEAELSAVIETLTICNRYHVDAIIVQDLGVARLIRTTFPELTLHASTQMAIHNLSGALSLKKMGFKRVVLARELSLSEIQKIQKESGLEVEVFIHGALCYSYSGLCLFSSMTTGRSANRGKCVYSCRSLFKLNGRQYHPFSMKDLALEKDALKLPGLSLKIEGRKKTPLYVGAVTDYYRRILDTGKIDGNLTDNLKQIFARPWTTLHFKGKNKAVIDPDFVGHRGLEIGHVDRIFNHTITFKPTHALARYDGIQIDVPGEERPFGFSAENLIAGGKKVFEVKAGQTVTLSLPPHHPFIQKGNTVYLSSSTYVKGKYTYTRPKPDLYKNRVPIDVDIVILTDKIMACCQGKTAEIQETLSVAQNPEKTNQALHRSFDKTGDTAFLLDHLTIYNEHNLFVPASLANELRRRLYEELPSPYATDKEPSLPKTHLFKDPSISEKRIVKTDQLSLAKSLPESMYHELIYVISPNTTIEELQGLNPSKLRLSLPTIIRPESLYTPIIQTLWNAGFHKWEIGNISGFSLLPHTADIAIDYMIPLLNTQALCQAQELGASYQTFSIEDTQKNISVLANQVSNVALVVYADVPLFLSANCIRENDCRSCQRTRLETPMTNGKGNYTAISENCFTVVLDNRPFYIPKSKVPANIKTYRFDFCHHIYSKDQVLNIIYSFEKSKALPTSFSGNFEKQFAT